MVPNCLHDVIDDRDNRWICQFAYIHDFNTVSLYYSEIVLVDAIFMSMCFPLPFVTVLCTVVIN